MEYKFTALQGDATKFLILESGFVRLKRLLDRWNQNLVTRKQLRELDDDQLKDIGIDRISAQRESGKPFWEN